MRTPAGILKAPPYVPKGEKKELPPPFKATILPLNFLPSKFRQNEQGSKALSDHNLQKKLAAQLQLSGNAKQAGENARDKEDSTFKHIFGSNCKFNLQPVNRIYYILII